MMYKDIGDPNPRAKTRMLRRLWCVLVYDGDPDDPDTEIREETVIAWNAIDANRKVAGQLAERPEDLGWVTWPRTEEDLHVYLINNPTDGPLPDKPVNPSVGGIADEEDWDF